MGNEALEYTVESPNEVPGQSEKRPENKDKIAGFSWLADWESPEAKEQKAAYIQKGLEAASERWPRSIQ